MLSAGSTDRVRPLLCIHNSPRGGGNTDLLLEAFALGAQEAGGQTEHIHCRYLSVRPCTGCEACRDTGACVIADDMSGVYRDLDDAAALMIGTPVYFLGAPSPLKALIDRCKCRWSRAHEQQKDPTSRRPGALLSAALAVFTCLERTVGALFDAVGFAYRRKLLYEGIDAKGAIRDHPRALHEARSLGVLFAQLAGAKG